MGFTWPVPRRDAPVTGRSFLAAAMLTGLGVASLSGPLTRLYRVDGDGAPLREDLLREAVTFVTTNPPASRVRAPVSEAALTRARTSVVPETPRVDVRGDSSPPSSSVSAASRDRSATADATQGAPASSTAGRTGPANAASFVVLPRPQFGRAAPLSAVQRDSALHQLSLAVPRLAATRRPTLEERDSVWRDESRRRAAWREQGRPVPMPIASGGFPLPLFSLGPSRRQRMRDSVVHRDNLLRLERLAERAHAIGDTTRTASARRGSPAP